MGFNSRESFISHRKAWPEDRRIVQRRCNKGQNRGPNQVVHGALNLLTTLIKALTKPLWQVTDVSGNCVTATCGSMNKDFQFPHDLKRLNILDITFPNDGQLMHLESCICVGSAATLSFKAGTLTRLKLTTAGTTVIHRMSRTNERDFNVGDSNISGSDFFAKLSRCSPLTNQNGSIFESDNRKSRKGPQCVPVYHDSGMYYSMFMAGQNKQALKGWQHEHLNSAGIVAEVCHSQSSRTWSLPTLIADPLFDGRIEYAARVNVTRDLFGFEGSAYNRW